MKTNWDGYDAWICKVDDLLQARLGLDHDDFEDWLWNEAYQKGESPNTAVARWYKDATRYM